MQETQFGFRKGRGAIDAIYILKKTVNEEIIREKGKVWAFMADMKAAFDKIDTKELWRSIERLEVDGRPRKRIEELYEDTTCKIAKGEREICRLRIEKGVCQLSPTLFNLDFVDMEEEMKKVQEGGLVLDRKKIYTLSYADDVILLANNETGMNGMLRRFRKHIERKGLELNVKK